MPWFPLPAQKQLGGFKSASLHGTANQNYNGIVLDDEKGHEHLAIHSERNMSLNAEYDKMVHAGAHKGERVSGANVLTVGRLSGGGSGGGFDAGDNMPEPPPLGVVGLNSVTVFGDNLQTAVGLNHQLAVGSNIQICINPLGMAAGVPGFPGAPALIAALASGQGGNMQFTVGTSANFVLGQEFDINLGRPRSRFRAPTAITLPRWSCAGRWARQPSPGSSCMTPCGRTSNARLWPSPFRRSWMRCWARS